MYSGEQKINAWRTNALSQFLFGDFLFCRLSIVGDIVDVYPYMANCQPFPLLPDEPIRTNTLEWRQSLSLIQSDYFFCVECALHMGQHKKAHRMWIYSLYLPQTDKKCASCLSDCECWRAFKWLESKAKPIDPCRSNPPTYSPTPQVHNHIFGMPPLWGSVCSVTCTVWRPMTTIARYKKKIREKSPVICLAEYSGVKKSFFEANPLS